VRLTRFNTEKGYQIFASQGESWVSLSSIKGFGPPVRIADLLDESRRRELARVLDSLPDDARADVPLCDAASILDAGDIWGAGLNYRGHSEDLNVEQPESGPGSYLRPRNCLINNGQQIELPVQSKRVTAEAELGLVIGTQCKDVQRDDWQSVIGGVTAVLDMTAEDAVRENPRYIPWSKGFDTFCSAGPQLVTMDEFDDSSLDSVRVSTILNDAVIATALVSDMKYSLGYLVEYFTAGRTLSPGTVICTGTPGAAVITSGDRVESVVTGVGTLVHTVR
jgi:2-keto-4-pentenoate hydratase/2-oxohepta-3-ene-1,7-dioic acid hydratase in catechol pathway